MMRRPRPNDPSFPLRFRHSYECATCIPRIDVREAPIVDTGAVVTGGGVSLCIDTTLHILADMLGEHVASETARILEYQRAREANRNTDAFLAGRTRSTGRQETP